MSRTEKHRVHCNCIGKDIDINVIHLKEQGVEVMSGTTCNTVNPKEPIHNCEFKNTENCLMNNYK